ncbi:MAG: hypothetical protein AAGN66_16245 [Acidobacteriota bacterium]
MSFPDRAREAASHMLRHAAGPAPSFRLRHFRVAAAGRRSTRVPVGDPVDVHGLLADAETVGRMGLPHGNLHIQLDPAAVDPEALAEGHVTLQRLPDGIELDVDKVRQMGVHVFAEVPTGAGGGSR